MNENVVLLVLFMSCGGAAVCVLVSATSDMAPLGRSLCGRGQGTLQLLFDYCQLLKFQINRYVDVCSFSNYAQIPELHLP